MRQFQQFTTGHSFMRRFDIFAHNYLLKKQPHLGLNMYKYLSLEALILTFQPYLLPV